MKNIERPEVILPMLKFLTEPSYGTAYLLEDLFKLGMPDDNFKRTLWLSSEYVEPHKWEPWELEAMKHIDKKVIKLGRTRADGGILEYRPPETTCGSSIDYPSIKKFEVINIDEELERNGMHR